MRAVGRGPGRPRRLRPTRGLRLRRFLLAANAQVSARSRSSERGSCRPQTGEAPERGGTDGGQREAGTAPHVPGSEEKWGFLDCCLSKRRAVTRRRRKEGTLSQRQSFSKKRSQVCSWHESLSRGSLFPRPGDGAGACRALGRLSPREDTRAEEAAGLRGRRERERGRARRWAVIEGAGVTSWR